MLYIEGQSVYKRLLQAKVYQYYAEGKKERKQVKYLLFRVRVSQKTQLLLDAFSILIVVYNIGYTIIYYWALSVE